jgi:glycosyltransferase involved in cell wall biosynthesis
MQKRNLKKPASNTILSVCIIIPAYNEARVIGRVISDIRSAFKQLAYKVKIVIVDDGSADTTADTARRSGATVVSHILNCGAGGATATGLRYAEKHGFDIACTMDADGQHKATDVVTGIQVLIDRKADLMIGSRLINSEGMSRIKVIGNKGLSFITYILFGVNSTDSQSGLRIFSRKALENLKWKTNGYEFCSEMLWRAHQLGLSIDEYPIEAIYTTYSKSKGQNNWNAINIIKSLLKRRILELFG